MLKNYYIKLISKAILAGLLIAMAGWIYLVVQGLDLGGWNKVIGSFMFSIGLVAVVILEANLFTGKVGYINTKQKLIDGIIIVIVNLLIAYLIGLLYQGCIEVSNAMVSRIEKSWYRIFVDGLGCGVCIYIAVEGYKKTKSLIPVILGVMAFILGGFEHCVADAFYLGASEFSLIGLAYIGLAVLGNSLGSLLTRWLQTLIFVEKNESEAK